MLVHGRFVAIAVLPGCSGSASPFSACSALALACRALEFMMAIMKRLLDDPEVSMSDVVYQTYHATLHQWHGFLASSAFSVSIHVAKVNISTGCRLGWLVW